jgi:PTS system nitrogen regulatory IIA component
MDLKIKDVADLLNVSETTIRRWLVDGKIPAYRINHQYRFNRMEIEDWVLRHRLGSHAPEVREPRHTAHEAPASEGNEPPTHRGRKQFSLYRAIHIGGIHHCVPGETKESVIRTMMKTLSKSLGFDAEAVTDMLLEREAMMPTALNNGIGVPHTRDFLLKSHQDVVAVVFPEQHIDYGALDGQPVHTLFFLFASDDKSHLNLLAKVAHFSSQPHTLSLLKQRPEKSQLLSHIKEWEGALTDGLLEKSKI